MVFKRAGTEAKLEIKFFKNRFQNLTDTFIKKIIEIVTESGFFFIK